MKLRHRLEYTLALSFSALFRLAPRPLALVMGAGLGQLAWWLGIRRKLQLANLEIACPDLDPDQRRALAARSVRNFGRTVAEYARLGGREQQRIPELVELEGVETLLAALQEGRGAVIVTGHLGAWAMYMGRLRQPGIAPALLVGRQHNPGIDRLILDLPGPDFQFISKGPAAPREILKCLRANKAVVLVADQHSSRGIVSLFLGKPAATLSLPGGICSRHGTPLFLLEGYRLSTGRHRAHLQRLAIPEVDDPATLPQAITDRFNTALGEAILRHPDQYFWFHRRWRV